MILRLELPRTYSYDLLISVPTFPLELFVTSLCINWRSEYTLHHCRHDHERIGTRFAACCSDTCTSPTLIKPFHRYPLSKCLCIHENPEEAEDTAIYRPRPFQTREIHNLIASAAGVSWWHPFKPRPPDCLHLPLWYVWAQSVPVWWGCCLWPVRRIVSSLVYGPLLQSL